jgi:hypothetical protein
VSRRWSIENELWKVILIALVGGTGVVLVLELRLLGISHGRTATKPNPKASTTTLGRASATDQPAARTT